MGRRDLNGVAAGLATSFVSRNNDVEGFWSLGLLRRFADRRRLISLRFDLIAGQTEPDDQLLVGVCRTYQSALKRQLATRRLDRALVLNADILVSFAALIPSTKVPPPETYGSPFSCCVRLLDDRQREHSHTVIAHCAPHDPQLERASTRAFRSQAPS